MRRRLLWIGLLAGLPAAAAATGQQPASVTAGRVAEVVLDGALAEWPAAASLTLRPGVDGAELVGPGAADAGADGLEVELWLARDEGGLLFAIRWQDDVWDTRPLGYADGRWSRPDGGQMDRMYFFDHIGLRLRWPDRLYSLWLAPRADGTTPVQWELLRDGPPARTSPIREVRLARAVTRAADGAVTIEGRLPWAELGVSPAPLDDLELIVLTPDSDCAGAELDAKLAGCMKYLRWTGAIRWPVP